MRYNIVCPSPLLNDKNISGLIDNFVKRIQAPVDFIEIKCKTNPSDNANTVIEKQSKAIVEWLDKQKSPFIIVLDERGKALSSHDLSKTIQSAKVEGYSNFCFVIGGAYGLDGTVRQYANQTISFGKMVWPHKFVGLMLCEQIYRSETIALGHPYHK